MWAGAVILFGHTDAGWQQNSFGTVSSPESSPNCCHPRVLEGVVYEPAGRAKLWGRGEKMPKGRAVLDILQLGPVWPVYNPLVLQRPCSQD